MNIAITGGNGFIGSHLSAMINKLGHKIIYISRSKRKVDKKNFYTYEDLFQLRIKLKIDCFIHLASPNYDYANDNSLKEGITFLTSNILSVLDDYNCNKLIFFSSAKVYGEPSLSKEVIFYEDTNPVPISDYGKEKLKAENKIITHANNSNLDYLIYRIPMVYGMNSNSNIIKLLNYIEKSYPFILFKNANHLKKSFISIENIKLYIKYNLHNLESIKCNTFNITDESNICLNELVINYKKNINSKSLLIIFPYFCLKYISKIPILGRYFIKLYGHFEISNKNVKKAYKIECSDTHSSVIHMKYHE